jgi:hypothetical protein
MKDPNDILVEFTEAVKVNVINSMQAKGRMATGQTANAIASVKTPDGAQLQAPEYIEALEKGRAPTRPGAPKADPPLVDRIEAWLTAKGLDYNKYAVTKSIHKNGYPGKPGVLTEPLSEENVGNLLDQKLGKLADIVATNLLNDLNI